MQKLKKEGLIMALLSTKKGRKKKRKKNKVSAQENENI